MMNKNYYRLVCQLLFSALVCPLMISAQSKTLQVDYLIKDAWVFDGFSKDSVKTDVGITGDKITYIGNSQKDKMKGKRLINAKGLYLSPGFIDPHTHTEADLSSKEKEIRANLPYLFQGVTSVVAGNDGASPYPIAQKLTEWNKNGIGTNAALLVGHGTIRTKILGRNNIKPSESQLEKMKELFAKGMKDGAFGMSTGLYYAPGSYAETDEVVALAKVVKSFNGIYDTHMRSEGTDVLKSIRETIEIGERTGIPLHISHLKLSGIEAWKKTDEVLGLINRTIDSGLKLNANQYPFTASSTGLSAATVPRWAEDGGRQALLQRFKDPMLLDSIKKAINKNIKGRSGPSNIVLYIKAAPEFNGKSLTTVAKEWGKTPEDVVVSLLEQYSSPKIISHSMNEENVQAIMKQPWVMTGSDGTSGHPRKYASFTKKIREYVLDKKIISMARAINNATYLTAQTFGIDKRGAIKVGYYADVILFDPQTIKDTANFDNPFEYAQGMQYVFVNGKPAIERGSYTGILAGIALKK